MSGRAVPDAVIYPAYIIGACAFFVFAYNFYRTLRTMGYEIWFAIALLAWFSASTALAQVAEALGLGSVTS